MKVDEQTEAYAEHLQVRDDLGVVDRKEPFRCLDLDDQATFNQKVESISTVEVQALVPHGDRQLTLDPKSTNAELEGKAVLVG